MKRVPMEGILEDEELVAWLDGELFTGVAFEKNGPCGIASEVTYVDGLQEGLARDRYPSGQMKASTWYRGGVQHGEEKEWYSDGSRKLEAAYEFGILLEKKTWSDDGTRTEDYVLGTDDPLQETLRLARATCY